MENARYPDIPADLLDRWQKLVDLIAEMINVPSALVTRLDGAMVEVLRGNESPANVYKTGLTAKLAGLYCEEVIRTQKPLHLPDARRTQRWSSAPELEHGLICYLGWPLNWPDGQPFGTLCFLDTKARDNHGPGSRVSRLLGQFADVINAHLKLIWQAEQLRRARGEIAALRDILPICSRCKKVRDDKGYWRQVEEYFAAHTGTTFTHSLCAECADHYIGQSPLPKQPAPKP
jgi:GAF domain-containing protein